MNEQFIQRRTPSPRVVAFRNERTLVAGMRREIAALQKKVAFVEARALSTRTKADAVLSEIESIKGVLASSSARLEGLMQGQVGIGPAEDCRKALAHMIQRLASIPN